MPLKITQHLHQLNLCDAGCDVLSMFLTVSHFKSFDLIWCVLIKTTCKSKIKNKVNKSQTKSKKGHKYKSRTKKSKI